MRERQRSSSTDQVHSTPRPRPAVSGRRRSTVLVVALVVGLVGIPASTSAHDVDREFLVTKVPFRHVWLSSLPVTSSGEVDGEQLLLEASVATLPAALLHLAPSLDAVAEALRAGDEDTATSRWRSMIVGTRNDGTHMDINRLIDVVVRDAYLESNADLRHYAQKVRYYNEQEQQIRGLIREAEHTRSSLPDDCEEFPDRCDLVIDVDRWIVELNTQLDQVEENFNLQYLQLQSAIQNENRLYTMVSNIKKSLHATVKATIGNIR